MVPSPPPPPPLSLPLLVLEQPVSRTGTASAVTATARTVRDVERMVGPPVEPPSTAGASGCWSGPPGGGDGTLLERCCGGDLVTAPVARGGRPVSLRTSPCHQDGGHRSGRRRP